MSCNFSVMVRFEHPVSHKGSPEDDAASVASLRVGNYLCQAQVSSKGENSLVTIVLGRGRVLTCLIQSVSDPWVCCTCLIRSVSDPWVCCTCLIRSVSDPWVCCTCLIQSVSDPWVCCTCLIRSVSDPRVCCTCLIQSVSDPWVCYGQVVRCCFHWRRPQTTWRTRRPASLASSALSSATNGTPKLRM